MPQGGSFFVLSDRGRDDAPPVFPRGHFRPTNIAPLPSSLGPSHSRPPSLPPPSSYLFIPLSLSLSLLHSIFYSLSWGASNIFLSSRSRPWINYSPTLNIWAFCAGMGPPSRDQPQKGREMGDIDWSTSLVGGRNVVVESAILQFLGKLLLWKKNEKKRILFASIQYCFKFSDIGRDW